MRLETLRGGFDDHQMATATAVVPATGGIEHRCRMPAAEVVHQVRPLSVGYGTGQQLARLGASNRLPRAGRQRQTQRGTGTAGCDAPEGGGEIWHGCPFGANVSLQIAEQEPQV